MGKNQPWKDNGTSYGASYGRSWHLWSGAKPPQQRPWQQKDHSQQRSFPAFDAQPISMGSAGWDMIRREATETGEADGQQMIQDLQTLANSARKAEGRMAKAYAAREQTKAQWASAQTMLKTSYVKEKRRFTQAMERQEKEVAEAHAAQSAARALVRQAIAGAPATNFWRVSSSGRWRKLR